MMTHKTITQISSQITREAREKKLGHPGAVVWFTGFSGAGKSTLAVGLEAILHQQGIATCILDGDNLRHGLCSDLGFSAKDRTENIRRTGEVAKLFAEAGLVVLCALISPFRVDRERVRNLCKQDRIPFLEIFVDAPLAVCEERDPRGLYAKARRGEITDFTGIDSAYEAPEYPELHLLTNRCSSKEGLEQLYSFLAEKLKIKSNFVASEC
jgi:adenylyl-sulfate kinase